MTEKAAALSERVEVLSRRSIREKLLCYFGLLAGQRQRQSVQLPFSLSALADYISADRSAMMRELKKTNPNIVKSIFQGINGLQLDTFPGFKHRGVFHSFPELYNHPDWFAGETKSEEISEEL